MNALCLFLKTGHTHIYTYTGANQTFFLIQQKYQTIGFLLRYSNCLTVRLCRTLFNIHLQQAAGSN